MAFKILYRGQLFESDSNDTIYYRKPDYSITPFVNLSALLPTSTFTGYTASTANNSGTVTGATNGLSLSAKNIRLGGILTGNTSIVYGTSTLILSGSSGSLLQNTSNGFGSVISVQSVKNSGTEVSRLSSNGTQTWSLFNTSGTNLGNVAINSPGSNTTGLLFSGGAQSFQAGYNNSNATFFMLNGAGAANTLVSIGVNSNQSATSTLQVRGRGTTTGSLLKLEDIGGSSKVSILDNGTGTWANTQIMNGTLAASFGPSATGTALIGEVVQVRNDQNAATTIGINNATNTTAASAEILLKAGVASFSSTGLRIGNFAPSFAGGSQFQQSQSTIHDYGNGLNLSGVGGVSFYTANNYRGKVAGGGQWLFGGNAITNITSEIALFRKDATNTFASVILLNGSDGTAASAGFFVRAGAANLNDGLSVNSFAPSYTSSGINQASKAVISAANLGGLNIGTTISTPLQFWTNNTLAGQFKENQVFVTTSDAAIDNGTKGLILKDTQATPHYWRITISNTGVLTTTDIGTALP